MGSLQSGVILKLLEDMGVEEKTVNIDGCCDYGRKKKPALLQIRGIIPVLAEGDLWPKQGFFIKVSDSTHAIYVSLHQEEDEMVLCNKLQLGQFIYVEKLEVAYPVPMLKGVKPIPGRQPFDDGESKDLVGIDIVEKFCGKSKFLIQDRTDVKKKSREKGYSKDLRRASIGGQNCKIRTGDVNINEGFDWGCSRKKRIFSDKGKDSDGLMSSNCSSVSPSRRRSWCGTTKTRSWEIPDSKHEINPLSLSSSSHPVRSARYCCSDGKPNTRTGIRDSSHSSKPVKSPNNGWNSSPARTSKELPFSDRERAETEILWDTLPSSLVKLGKEVLRQRDVALLAAVEALQEAAAAERLLRCLSTFSELQLAKENDQQPSITKFFKLQDYMAQCKAIIESLTHSTSPLRMVDNGSKLNSPRSTREAVKLAMDRKKNATTWAKAAVATDLISLSAAGRTKTDSSEGKNEAKSTKKPSHQVTKPKGTCTNTKQRNIGEFYSELAAEKENLPDWMKGSTLKVAGNLAHSLQEECRTWFLGCIENYLDGFDNECLAKVTDSRVGESMCQLKRLNDWLDMNMMEKNEASNNEKCRMENWELEACGRVRNKIYGVLLKHVERTAMVLENMNIATA